MSTPVIREIESAVGHGAEQSCSSEIDWPTLFFWMVCFAVNSSAQPTGRVLGLSYRHQALLRSSPIICACDVLGVVASMVDHVLHAPGAINVRDAAGQVFMERLVDRHHQPDAQTLKALKSQAKARWAGFILGALPQFIKLFASKGIPFSQALGAMYLASWLFFELLIFIADAEDGYPTSASSRNRRSEQVVKAWALCALTFDIAVYSIPTWFVWTNVTNGFLSSPSSSDAAGALVRAVIRIDWILATSIGLSWPLWSEIRSLLGAIGIVARSDPALPEAQTPFWFLGMAAVVFHFISPACAILLDGSYMTPRKGGSMLHALMVLYIGGPLGIAVGAGVAYKKKRRRVIAAVFSVLALFIQPLIFYGMVYESKGTEQPEWVRWLG